MADRQGNPCLALMVLASFSCIFFGLYSKKMHFVYVGFALIPAVLIILWISTMKKTKESGGIVDNFSKTKTGHLPLKDRPADLVIPALFRVSHGQLSFDDLTDIIKIDPDFLIFHHSYSYRAGARRRHVSDELLTFLLTVAPVAGYHRFILKNPVGNVFLAVRGLSERKDMPDVEVADPDIREAYQVKSSDVAKAVRIVSLIAVHLKRLKEACVTTYMGSIDLVPTNLEIHITDKYVLARMGSELWGNIETLYPIFKDMQRSLASW